MDEEFDDAQEYFGAPRPVTPSGGWRSLLETGFHAARTTAQAAFSPIQTTKQAANVLATTAQNALAKSLGVEPELVGNVFTKPVELLVTASTETRELTSLWIQFIVSLIGVLRTPEAADMVTRSADTGIATLSILRSPEFSEMNSAIARFVASNESTALVGEVAHQAQRWLAILRTEESQEATSKLLTFVQRVVSLMPGSGITSSPPGSPPQSRPSFSAAHSTTSSPSKSKSATAPDEYLDHPFLIELLVKIDDLNDEEELSDEEAAKLRKLARNRNQGLALVWAAHKKDDRRLLRSLREIVEDDD